MSVPHATIGSRVLRTIRRSQRRVVASRLLGALAEGLVVALLLTLAFGVVAHDQDLSAGVWTAWFWLLALAFLGFVAWRSVAGASLRAVAVMLDRRLHFHDRVSSALDFLRLEQPSAFMRAHLEETAAFLEENGDRAVPFDWPSQGRALVLFLALSLVALIPHGDRSVLPELDRRTAREALKHDARKLVTELAVLRREADLHGLKKLNAWVAAAEEVLNRQVQLLTEEELKPPPTTQPSAEGQGASSTKPESDRDADAEFAGTAGKADRLGKVALSSSASYKPVGKFDAFPDATYTEVFAEIDGVVIDSAMNANDLKNLAQHLDQSAAGFNNFAGIQGNQDTAMEGMRRGPRGGRNADNSIDQAIATGQFKAFSEFLKRYADHVQDRALGQARKEITEQANPEGEVFRLDTPPPKDAKVTLQGVSDKRPDLPLLQADPSQLAQLAAQTGGQGGGNAQKSTAQGLGTELGGSGAGVGASDHTAGAPAVLPQAEGGAYLPLKGKLADGKSLIQLIHDRGRRNLAAPTGGGLSYQEVFVEYAHAAEAELNSEDVPAHMRDYIREYFRSIRPAAEAGGPSP